MSRAGEQLFRIVTVVYLTCVFLYLVAPILVSGSTDRLNLIRMALRFGAHAAMQKPIMRRELVETVRAQVQGDAARPRDI